MKNRYLVDVKITGWQEIEVIADTIEEAREEAREEALDRAAYRKGLSNTKYEIDTISLNGEPIIDAID